MPIQRKGRFNYFTGDRTPNFKKDKRIKMPAVPKRPYRFSPRSMIDYAFLTPTPFPGFVIHRRGPARPWMGDSPLEMRAQQGIPGTLPERIIYKYLTTLMKFSDGVDFDFQSSLQGGRIDTGGIVADFMFERLRIVINPLGPTHDEFLRMKKDQEQVDALGAMGYQVYMIPEADVYDELTFERLMKQIFGWTRSGAGEQTQPGDMIVPGYNLDTILNALIGLHGYIGTL